MKDFTLNHIFRNNFLPAMKAIILNGNKLMSIPNGATTCSNSFTDKEITVLLTFFRTECCKKA